MSAGWFMQREGNEYGPYSWEELQGFARDGRIQKDDMVKSEQMAEWARAAGVPGLFAAPAKEAPPAAPASSTPQPAAAVPTQAPAAPVAPPAAKKKKSPLKILAIVGGSIVGLAVLGFVALVVIGLLMSTPAEVTGVVTAQRMTVDERPADVSDTFFNHVPEIFVAAEVTGAPSGTLLTAVWYWEEEGYLMDSVTIELLQGDSRPYFSYAPAGEWPLGSYRVELLLDEEPVDTARFAIIVEEGTITHVFDEVSGEYQGELRSGVPHGYGDWAGQDGGKYYGEWLDGDPHGYGVYDYPDLYYEGEWFQGLPHGSGSLFIYDELEYSGGFKDGDFHGEGALFVYGELEYTGGFKHGELHGEGTLILFEDGTIIEGTWIDGQFIE